MTARILLAEDQTDISDLIETNLRQAGYTVHCVGDGIQALAAERKHVSDL